MKSSSQRALQIFLASVLLLISCDVSTLISNQQIPTPIPGAINLIVAQTAAAAATQTAAIIPPTLTPTLTPFPTQTPLDTPTVTPTFIFLLPTFTPTITPTDASTVFTCSLMSQSPGNGTHFAPSQSFTLTWKVRNTGSSNWIQKDVYIEYVSGAQFTGTTVIEIPKALASGNFFNLVINMTAPSKIGNYTTHWTLTADGEDFCSLSMQIKVP